MLTLKLISEETERVIKGLNKKHFAGAEEAVNEVLAIDKRRRETQQELDQNLSEAKKMAAQIGALMKQGNKQEADEVKAKVAAIKEANKALEETKAQAEKDLVAKLCTIPNIPNDDVPEGKDASDNVVVKEGGEMPNLPEDALCHWDLCKKFNLIDFVKRPYAIALFEVGYQSTRGHLWKPPLRFWRRPPQSNYPPNSVLALAS